MREARDGWIFSWVFLFEFSGFGVVVAGQLFPIHVRILWRVTNANKSSEMAVPYPAQAQQAGLHIVQPL
jgi:hypothetical protein